VAGHVAPRRRVDLVLRDAVELLVVDVPAELVGRDAAVPLEPVGVERRLARRPGAGPVRAQPGELVARTARGHAAVQHAPHRVDAVDVLHDVELTDRRPVLVVPAVRRAQGPERRPVAERRGPGHVGHPDAGLDPQRPAGRRLEVAAAGLDPGRGPAARGGAERRDAQVAVAVPAHVGRVGRVGLDLAGAPVRRATRVAGARVEDPVVARRQRAGRPVEVVAPDRPPARRRGRHGGRLRGRARRRCAAHAPRQPGHGHRHQRHRHGAPARPRHHHLITPDDQDPSGPQAPKPVSTLGTGPKTRHQDRPVRVNEPRTPARYGPATRGSSNILFGTTCHDRPNLSFSQPQGPSSPPPSVSLVQ
jgi:hypothetical protein